MSRAAFLRNEVRSPLVIELLWGVAVERNAGAAKFLCCFLLINHHAAGLVIGQRAGMIKRAGVHPNAGD